jgi:hypothetical protein
MRKYIAIFLCLVGLAMAVGYNDWQQGASEGLRMGFHMGQAYANALNGINVTGFNAEVDKYNAWVRQNFGEDTNLLMGKMNLNEMIDLQKPYMASNNTTTGMVHKIDGMNEMNRGTYTTNDINELPNSAINQYHNSAEGKVMGDGYLGGV